MAEITTNTRSPRVDMTPMVDLGFLLITFFVFTTTFTKPFMMTLSMPDDTKVTGPPLKVRNTLTLVLGKDNQIFWHQKPLGELKPEHLNATTYGSTLTKLIIDKRNYALNDSLFTVIIHPSDEASYKNAVDVMDEMIITNQKRYVLADIPPKEVVVYQAKVK